MSDLVVNPEDRFSDVAAHFTVDAVVSMFMRDNRILQDFCWMPSLKWSLQNLAIEMMMDVYQIPLRKHVRAIYCNILRL